MTKFNIGDTVYHASAGQENVWITCPECLGSGRLRVIMGDNSEVSIACVCCERGYEGSPGRIRSYQFLSQITEQEVTGIESRISGEGSSVRYMCGSWSAEEKDVFATREDAAARVTTLISEHEIEEVRRLRCKEKQTKTWACNVSYWKSEIRRAKETIARCEARLAVAPKTKSAMAMRDILEADAL